MSKNNILLNLSKIPVLNSNPGFVQFYVLEYITHVNSLSFSTSGVTRQYKITCKHN